MTNIITFFAHFKTTILMSGFVSYGFMLTGFADVVRVFKCGIWLYVLIVIVVMFILGVGMCVCVCMQFL